MRATICSICSRSDSELKATSGGAEPVPADALAKLKKAHDALLALQPRWTDAQKERWVPGLSRGELGAFGLTEPADAKILWIHNTLHVAEVLVAGDDLLRAASGGNGLGVGSIGVGGIGGGLFDLIGDLGGILKDIALGKGAGPIGDMIAGFLGMFGRGAFETAFEWVEDLISDWDNPAGQFGEIVIGFVKKILDGVIDFLTAKDEEATPSVGGGAGVTSPVAGKGDGIDRACGRATAAPGRARLPAQRRVRERRGATARKPGRPRRAGADHSARCRGAPRRHTRGTGSR